MVNDSALGFLFPGQGAQYQGMALDLMESPRVQQLFARASEIQGLDMAELIAHSDAEALMPSDISQPAITLANLAAAAYLEDLDIRPRICAGFSLGEYAAMVCAGILEAADCLSLVKARGRVMQEAAEQIARGASSRSRPGMSAVIGLTPELVEELLIQWRRDGLIELYGANFNSPKQVVVSGTAAALEIAAQRFLEAGAKRIVPLKVAGPFHSPFMADAAAAFALVLDSVEFRDPRIPCYSNVTGALIRSGAEAKALAVRHITEPVRWTAEEKALAERGDLDGVAEVGPGQVLQGLWRDAKHPIPIFPAGTVADIQNLQDSLAKEALYAVGT